MASKNGSSTDLHTKHTDKPTYREEEYIQLDMKLDELAYQSGQGARPLKNIKHEMFCQEYLKDFNGTRSAIDVGYSEHTAHVQASKLLKKTKIADRIRYLYRKRSQRVQASADDVVRELQKLAFSNIMDYVAIDSRGNIKFKSGDQMLNTEAISEIEITTGKVKKKKIKLHDKIRPLEKLMQHLGIDNPVELIIKMKKLEMDMMKSGVANTQMEDDGFLEAMNNGAEDVMAQFEQEQGGGGDDDE